MTIQTMPEILVGIGLAVAGAAGVAGPSISPVLFSIGTTMVLSSVAKALEKKQNLGRILQDSHARLLMALDPAPPWRVGIGSFRASGVPTFIHRRGTNLEYYHLILTMCMGPIQSIGDMYFDGELVPLDGGGDATGKYAGHVHVEKHLGDPADATQPFPDLATAAPTKWTSAHLQRGHAKVHIEFKLNVDLFPNGIPNVTFDILGSSDIYDPRGPSTGYTNLAALVVNWYLTHPKIGFGAVYANEIDETLLIAGANICDEAVTLKAGGSEDRYTINGMFDTSADRGSVLNQMAAAMAGYVVPAAGKYNIYAGAYRTPTVTLTESDAAGPINVQTRISKQEIFNGVKGTFFSAANNWQQADFPTVDGSAYLTEDGSERIWQDIQLPFTTSAATAQRLGKLLLERSRKQITVQFPLKLSAYLIQPPDVVKLTLARFSWTDKTFEVVSQRLQLDDAGALSVLLTLRETDATVYSWTAATDEKTPGTVGSSTLPDIQTVGQPTGLALSSGDAAATTGNDGLRLPRLKATWTAPTDEQVISGGHIIVQYKKNSDSVWIGVGTTEGDSTEFYIAGVTVGTAYDVRLIAVNSAGVAAAPVSALNHTVTGPTSISPSASYRPTTNPLTAADVGATATVSIAAFTMRFPGSDLSINAGAVTGLSFDTLYYIYYDDADFNGGSVTYGATTTKEVALNGNARFFVGSITTPADGTGDTVGNNDGGVGAQQGIIGYIRGTTHSVSGNVTAPEQAYDNDQNTAATILDNDDSSDVLTIKDFPPIVFTGQLNQLRVKTLIYAGAPSGTQGTCSIEYSTDGGSGWTVLFTQGVVQPLSYTRDDTLDLTGNVDLARFQVRGTATRTGGTGPVVLSWRECVVETHG